MKSLIFVLALMSLNHQGMGNSTDEIQHGGSLLLMTVEEKSTKIGALQHIFPLNTPRIFATAYILIEQLINFNSGKPFRPRSIYRQLLLPGKHVFTWLITARNTQKKKIILDLQTCSMFLAGIPFFPEFFLSGVPEKTPNNTEMAIKEFMTAHLKLSPDTVLNRTFHRVHRLGKWMNKNVKSRN